MTSADGKTVIFLHIPKAAGSTLQSILLKQYGPDEVCVLYGKKGTRGMDEIEKIKDYPEAERMKIRVLIGHMKFGLHAYLRAPAAYVTFLREPVSRIVSHYHYALNLPGHYLHDRVAGGKMTIKEYVAGGLSDELNNGQTRLLSGAGKSVPFGECTPELLETAKKNLRDHFALAALSERFDEGLILMKNLFGWKTPYYERKNVGKRGVLMQSLAEDTLEVIRKYNELDIRLYEHVKESFSRTVTDLPPSFSTEVRAFKRRNSYYGKFCWLKNIIRARAKKIFK